MLRPVALRAEPELTLPLDAHLLERLGFDPQADMLDVNEPLARYHRLRNRLLERQGLLQRRRAIPPDHRLLGHPTTVQNDVLDEAAALGLARQTGKPPELEQSMVEAARWRLLLQGRIRHRDLRAWTRIDAKRGRCPVRRWRHPVLLPAR